MKKTEIIYGINPVLEAINEGKEIEKLFLLKTMLPHKANEIKRLPQLSKFLFNMFQRKS